MTRRRIFQIVGFVLVLLGLFMSRGWYDDLSVLEDVPIAPVKGVTLLQIVLVLEGLALFWLSAKDRLYRTLAENERALIGPEPQTGSDGPATRWILAAIILLGFGLRLYRLSSDLWLDEITPILDYGKLPSWQVVASFYSSNNHLLNTLLMKLSVAWFGEHEWAVRLPAMLFGTATIPVLYWVARMAMSTTASLGAALLLATSYHHVFFSQNARGYVSHVFFSLLATGFLVRGLQRDRLRTWALYVVSMLLNFAALLLSGFVFAAHILVGASAVLLLWRRRTSSLPLARRLAAVFFVTGFLGFHLYATALPQAYMFVRHTYSQPASGWEPLSLEFLKELARGISAGLGPLGILAAVPVLLIAAVGFLALFRRHWVLTSALAVPLVLLAAYLLASGLTFTPRFFALALPVGILCGVQGLFSAVEWILKRAPKESALTARLSTALVLVGCAVSLLSLRHYYSLPKQPYSASLRYLESQRKPGEIVIVIHLAEKGYLYYGKRFGIEPGKNYFFVRSVEALDEVLSSHPGQRTYLVTTFPRFLELHSRELAGRVSSDWEVAQKFPATVGDGAITVWKPREQ
jgi:4-amino-4-deoxy-L-arabinose transferase-like glycosyltransferase